MIRAAISAAIALIASTLVTGAEIPLSNVVYTGAAWWQDQPQAASDGTNFLIAWRDYREQRGYPTIYAKLVGGDGQLLHGPTALSIPDPHDRPVNGSTNAAPAVAWAGSVYLVFWDDMSTRSARYVRIDRDGNLLDAAPQVIPGVTMLRAGAAASGSRGAMLVYADTGEHPSVHGVVFGSTGEVIARDIALPHGFVDDNPVVASNGDSFLVSWRRWEGGTTGDFVVTARVALDGAISQEHVVDMSLGWPALASNGEDFAILYVHRSKQLVAAHLDADGKLLSRSALPDTFGWPFPDNPIGRYGNGYVVAIHGMDSSAKGIVLDRDGKPVSEIGLSTRGVAHYVVAFAANSHETLAVWPEQRAGVSVDRDIFARVLGAETDTLVTRSAARQSDPRIASSGSGYLAVWLEYRGLEDGEVRASRMSPQGRPLDGEGIKLGAHAYRAPQVVFDGSNYIVAWFNIQPGQSGIMTSRITPDGVLLDGPGGRVAIPEAYWEFGLGTNGRESLLVWIGYKGYYRAGAIGQDGILHAPFVDIPFKEHGVRDISVAGTVDTWFVAWSEEWTPPWPFGLPPPVFHNVIAERISTSSLLALDPDPLPIATSDLEERRPSVATNGIDSLVSWDQSDGNVVARAVTRSGTLGDPVSFGRGSNPSATWSGNHYDVGWETAGDLFTARFAAHPVPIALANSTDAESHVAITATPAHGLFALYERVASEAIYGYVSRVFARGVPPSTRVRSVGR